VVFPHVKGGRPCERSEIGRSSRNVELGEQMPATGRPDFCRSHDRGTGRDSLVILRGHRCEIMAADLAPPTTVRFVHRTRQGPRTLWHHEISSCEGERRRRAECLTQEGKGKGNPPLGAAGGTLLPVADLCPHAAFFPAHLASSFAFLHQRHGDC